MCGRRTCMLLTVRATEQAAGQIEFLHDSRCTAQSVGVDGLISGSATVRCSCTSSDVQKDDSYTGRGRVERRGRDLGLRRCDRVAVEQQFYAD